MNNKIAVIFFHKNINKIYKKDWIDKCIKSILNQEEYSFDIFEINYGNEDKSIFNDYNLDNIKHTFYKKNYKTHIEAMVFLLKKCFDEYNYDYVFNTNLDDYYDTKRFKYQIENLKRSNSVINSSMWCNIQDNKFKDIYLFNKKFRWYNYQDKYMNDKFHKQNINIDIIKFFLFKIKKNVINHSGVCFTKNFWNAKDNFNNKINYRNNIPFEDYSLWERLLKSNYNISIVNKNLIYYRLHNNQITKKKINIKEPILKENRKGLLIKINNLDDVKLLSNKDYYFLYVLNNIKIDIEKKLVENNINNYDLITFAKNDNKNLEEIKILFDVNLDICCDNLEIII
tara:strand:- start:85 stop:1107 length:1023 start_codon:yes stop_codon:yes gene_type:complete